ncbi:MAG: hypothetical protein OXU33_13095 [Gemmatimonadota bacterium]|nr:hypothetical protein [Gemmatimonadota bacterium]MDE3007234.1 hypothetical protein [Gemmatimonadota bacterium]MDE3015000.1 hypothetical protein [Gemmatimonadota bacterium]
MRPQRIRTLFGLRSLGLITVVFLGVILVQGCDASSNAAWLEETVRTPRVFAPNVISTGLREYGITFSPDGQEAYFTRRPRRGPPQIFASRFEEGSWGEPVPVPFSSEHDEAPSISADGQAMMFVSRRHIPGSGDRSDNIWVVNRGENGWGPPTPLVGLVNQPRSETGDFVTGSELGPVMLLDGSILFWSRSDPDWGADIYRSELLADGTYEQPVPLRINSTGEETNVAMSPDGRFLIFQAYRDASAPGNQDLYVSRQNEHGWDAPVPLPSPVNSPANDGFPSFSPDGRFFFFASDRSARGGYYDIWYVGSDMLGLETLTR